jgi:hypothetical protein
LGTKDPDQYIEEEGARRGRREEAIAITGVYGGVMEDMLLVRGHVPEPIMVHEGTLPPILFD